MTGQTAKPKITRKKTTKIPRQEELRMEQIVLNNPPERSRLLVLTNRYNLIDMLSSGLIKPSSKYLKYYNDLGATCPEGIPLLLHNPSISLIDEVIDHTPGSFPVLLELDPHDLQGHVQAVRNDYQIEETTWFHHGDAIALVAAGVIPFSYVQIIHFRSISEREEHIAREYENIRPNTIPLQISPELFMGSTIDPAHLLEALTQGCQAIKTLPSEIFLGAEALSGALLMLGGLINRSIKFSLSTLLIPLKALQNSENRTEALQTIGNTFGANRWLTLLPALLLEEPDISASHVEASDVFKVVASHVDNIEDLAEFLLFVIIVKTLLHSTIDTYYNEEILNSIRNDFEKQFPSIRLEKDGESLSHYLDQLNAVHSVLHTRISLAEFSSSSPVITALLLFLLRSTPTRMLSWVKEKFVPEPDPLSLATIFTGVLYKRAMIPVENRPGILLEHHIDTIIAYKLNSINHSLEEPPSSGNISLETTIVGRIRRETLKISGNVLMQLESPIPSPTIAKDYIPPQKVPVSPLGTRPLHNEGTELPATLKTSANIFQRLLEADLKSDPEKDVAAYLCRIAGWEDCITTIMSLEGQRYILSASDPKKPKLQISGFFAPNIEIQIQIDKFRKRLTYEAWNSLPEQIRADIESKFKRNN